MGEVISILAARRARFRGSKDRPIYDDALNIMERRRSVSTAEIDAWLASFPPDGGHAA